MNYLKLVANLIVVLLLVGCSAANKSDDYQQLTASYKPTVLPSDLDGYAIENRYPVPKASNNQRMTDALVVPPGSKLTK